MHSHVCAQRSTVNAQKCTAGMVAESAGLVYFTATCDSPLERHLYCVGLEGTPHEGDEPPPAPRRITQAQGMHDIVALDHSFNRFIDSWSSTTCPDRVAVCALEDGVSVVERWQGGSWDRTHR